MSKAEIGCIIPRHVVNDMHKLTLVQKSLIMGLASLISWKNGTGIVSLRRLSERCGLNYSLVKREMTKLHPYIHYRKRHDELGHRIASEFSWTQFDGCCLCNQSCPTATLESKPKATSNTPSPSASKVAMAKPKATSSTTQSYFQCTATNNMNVNSEQSISFSETEDGKKLRSKDAPVSLSKPTESQTTALDQTTTATEFIDSFKAHYKVRFNKDYSSSVSQTEISTIMTAVAKLNTNHIPVKEFVKYIFNEHLASYRQGHVTISYVCDERAISSCVNKYGEYYREQYQDRLAAERDNNALKCLNLRCSEFPDDKRYKYLLKDYNEGCLILGQLSSELSKLVS